MKTRSILLFILISCFATFCIVHAQDIVGKLGGTTSTDEFQITDSTDALLFEVSGDKQVSLSADGMLDLSGITSDSTGKGLKLPAYNASATADGQMSWDSSGDRLYVGDGASAQQIGGISGIFSPTGHFSADPTSTSSLGSCVNGTLAPDSNDTCGSISFSGASATSGCQLLFGTAFNSAPVCVATAASLSNDALGDSDYELVVTSTTTTSVTFNAGSSSGTGVGFISPDRFNYICLGR